MLHLVNEITSENLLDQIDQKDFEQFNETFKPYGVILTSFTDQMFITMGMWLFDIVEFDKFLHKIGYRENAHGSMEDYLRNNFSEETADLIASLIEKYPKT